MSQRLKALVLALLSVCAIGAVATSAASAQKGTSDGPVTLVGTITGAQNDNSVTAFGGISTCNNPIGTGHKFNVTPHELIPSGSTTVTITPHYGLCTALGFPSTIDMNGCDYGIDPGGTVGPDEYAGSYTIICPEGKHVAWTLFSSAANHTAGKPFCEITTTENPAGYPGLRVRDTTNGTVDIVGTVEGIGAHKKSPTGSILCPAETTNTAILHMDVTLVGKNAVGQPTSISISE
jgi:hypothetical protein